MKLSAIFFIVLAELATGSALFASWQNSRKIRGSYFEFNAGFAAVIFMILCIWQAPLLSPFVLSLFLAAGAYWSFRREHFVRGRLLIKTAGLTGITFGIYSLATSTVLSERMPSSLLWIFLSQIVAGALLLGSVHGAMVLGHWYLLMRDLDFSHLRRASVIVGAMLTGRAILLVGTLFLIRQLDPVYAYSYVSALLEPSQNLFFFVMRVFWGLVLPSVLAYMVWRCAKTGSNQSATGLLYLAEVSVLIGETLAVYLRV